MMRQPTTPTSINGLAMSGPDTREELVGPLRADAQDKITRAGARAAKYHDRHRQQAPELEPGDLVFIASTRMGANAAKLAGLGSATTRKKALPRWVGLPSRAAPERQRLCRDASVRHPRVQSHQRQIH